MVTDWLVPFDREQLQRFLGFADSYRHFKGNASSVAAPLHTLTSLGTWVIVLKLPDQNLQLNRVTLLIWEWERRTTKFIPVCFFSKKLYSTLCGQLGATGCDTGLGRMEVQAGASCTGLTTEAGIYENSQETEISTSQMFFFLFH